MFILFSLPRSRTAWTAHVLAAAGFLVGHDSIIYADSIDDYIGSFKPRGELDGSIETGAAIGWRLLPRSVKIATIRRPRSEIQRSLAAFNWTIDEHEYDIREALLDQIEDAGHPRFEANKLNEFDHFAALSEHCTGWKIPNALHRHFCPLNIQINMAERLALLVARRERIEELKREIVDATRALSQEHAL